MEPSMESCLAQVLQKDVGRRLQVGQEIIDFIADRQKSQDLEQDQTMLDRMVDAIATTWVNSSNFKPQACGTDRTGPGQASRGRPSPQDQSRTARPRRGPAPTTAWSFQRKLRCLTGRGRTRGASQHALQLIPGTHGGASVAPYGNQNTNCSGQFYLTTGVENS